MGCHGTQGQNAGGDFSVLLANGVVSSPDYVENDVNTVGASRERSRKYL